MIDQKLVDYIKAEYARGTPLEKIRANLYANDWTEIDVLQAEKIALGQQATPQLVAQEQKPLDAAPIPLAAIAAAVIILVLACAAVYFVFLNKSTAFDFGSSLESNAVFNNTSATASASNPSLATTPSPEPLASFNPSSEDNSENNLGEDVADCGNDINCLIDYANINCSNAKVEFVSSTPAEMFGQTSSHVFVNRSFFFSISEDYGWCSVYSKLNSVVAYADSSYENEMLSTGMTQAQFDAQLTLVELLSGSGFSGFDGTCDFALGVYAGEFLNSYPQSAVNSSTEACVGYLFGSQESVSKSDFERYCSATISKKAGVMPYEAIVNASLSLPAGTTVDYSCGEMAPEGQATLIEGWATSIDADGNSIPVSYNYTTFDCVYLDSGNYSITFADNAGYECSLNARIGE